MTVGELLDLLATYPRDLPVTIEPSRYGMPAEVATAYHIPADAILGLGPVLRIEPTGSEQVSADPAPAAAPDAAPEP